LDNLNPKPAGEGRPEAPFYAKAGTAETDGTAKRHDLEREYHLDALRSVLMVMGVFLHASYLYAAQEPWLVKDNDSSRLLLWVNQGIHFFRIPCFFILSGFFAQMLLNKQGQGRFLRTRMRRLALPLTSTAILLNSLQSYFLHSSETHTRGLAAFIGSSDYAGFWRSGEWVGHLWFLVYVIVYSAAAAGMWGAWKRLKLDLAWIRVRARLRAKPSPYRWIVRSGFFMLLLPAVHLFILIGASFTPLLYRTWGGLSGSMFLQYLPYFLFGLIIFLNPRLRGEFHRVRPWQVLSLPAALILKLGLDTRFEGKPAEAISFYIGSYLVWSCCALLFAGFRFLLNRKYRIFAYLSDASYSIYLFHHVCVVALGLFMARKEWAVSLEYSIIVAVSLTVSILTHHFLVLRIRVLRLLFMGK
jgi:glucan biosynthesis protein C